LGRRLLMLLFLLVLVTGTLRAQGEPALLFDDPFDGVQDPWTVRRGVWTEEAGALASSPTFTAELLGGHPAWQDIRLHVELELPQEMGLAGRIVLQFRRQGDWHSYGRIVRAGGLELVRFDGGPRQCALLAGACRRLGAGEVHYLGAGVGCRASAV